MMQTDKMSAGKMREFRPTEPNPHKVLEAIRELEKDPAVRAYIALLDSLK